VPGFKTIFIIDSNLPPFQKKCRNKDYSQKLGAAIVMAQEAEKVNIQVGECSDHILVPIQDVDTKLGAISTQQGQTLLTP
jgi:hypothetical protein